MTEDVEYLGDATYAKFDGYYLRIWITDGMIESHPIFLDEDMFKKLMELGKEEFGL